MPPPVQGSLVQRAFSGGELTPAAWGRADVEKYAHGLKVARNGYIMRQGGFTNRPGTAMIAQTANGSNPVRLIPFIFSNNVSYALEFGDVYMRVYRAGAQIQGISEPYQIVAPYATADLPNIQYIQARNVLYLACAGYPVYKLTCTADTNWAFSIMTFVPGTVAPGGGSPLVFSDNNNYQPLYGSLPGGNIPNNVFSDNPGTGTGGGWDTPGWSNTGIGQLVTPGANGYPAGPELLTEYYMVTAVDLATGIESYPMPGSFSTWICTGAANGEQLGWIQTSPGVWAELFANKYQRNNSSNISSIVSITPGFPLIVTVSNGSNFPQNDDTTLFNFSGTGISQLDGLTSFGSANGNTVTFTGIDGSNFPVAVGPTATLTCLVSTVVAVPHAAVYGLNPGGDITSGTSFDALIAGYPFTAPQLGWISSALTFLNGAFTQGPLTLTWNKDSGPSTYIYNVYKKATNGLWGYMASVEGTGAGPYVFVDDGSILPDTSKAPPQYTQIGAGNVGDPSVIGMYQQRLLLGDTPDGEDEVYASNVGAFNQFTLTTPTPVDSDTVQFEVAGQEYNAITQFVDNGFLLIFTATGELSCYGNGSAFSPGPLTPTNIGLVQQAFFGASPLLKPLSIGKNVLYVQTMGSVVRELLYNYYINGYSGTDMTVWSNHLFDGYTIVDWCYQQVPNSLVQAVRSDGMLLTLTYLPELQMAAWTRSDTEGLFENVCSIPEGSEHALYCVVNRNGTRFVERFANQIIPNIQVQRYIDRGANVGQVKTVTVPDPTAWCFMDCSSFYDGRSQTYNPVVYSGQSGNVYYSIGTGDYTANGNGFTLNSVAFHDFYGPDGLVGQAFLLTNPLDGSVYKCIILDASSEPLSYLVRPTVTLPPNMSVDGFVVETWALGVNQLAGLDYLDGYEVSILADGAVVSSPSTETMVQVSGGVIPLDNYYAFVRVGLPYFSDLRSLNIDTPQPGQTNQDKKKLVNRVGIYTETSRGVWVGTLPPIDDNIDPFENLTVLKPRDSESLGVAPTARTGLEMSPVEADWAYGSGVFLRQPDPLPMSILSIIPAGSLMSGG